MTSTSSATRPRLRADAARNRERILAAARDAFVAEGTDVPLDEIARRAGLGNATLYRHFPDRKSLLFHVLLYINERIIERAEELGEAELEPFEALRRLVLTTAEERVGALCVQIGLGIGAEIDQDDPELVASRERAVEVTQSFINRARDAGQLRPDVGPADLLVAVARLSRPLPGVGGPCGGGEEDVELSRRHLQIFLDGLRTPPRSQLPGKPAELADLKAAVR